MRTVGTTIRKVAEMHYTPEEERLMAELDVLWLKTFDREHENILAYPINVQVNDIDETCLEKYVDLDEFYQYTDEFGSHWWVSESLAAKDFDAFFQHYFKLEQSEAA